MSCASQMFTHTFSATSLLSNEFSSAVERLSSHHTFGNEDTFSRMTEDLGGACELLKRDINGVCLEIVRNLGMGIRDDTLKGMIGKVSTSRQ